MDYSLCFVFAFILYCFLGLFFSFDRWLIGKAFDLWDRHDVWLRYKPLRWLRNFIVNVFLRR